MTTTYSSRLALTLWHEVTNEVDPFSVTNIDFGHCSFIYIFFCLKWQQLSSITFWNLSTHRHHQATRGDGQSIKTSFSPLHYIYFNNFLTSNYLPTWACGRHQITHGCRHLFTDHLLTLIVLMLLFLPWNYLVWWLWSWITFQFNYIPSSIGIYYMIMTSNHSRMSSRIRINIFHRDRLFIHCETAYRGRRLLADV